MTHISRMGACLVSGALCLVAAPLAAADDLQAALAGKTLTAGKASFELRKNGVMRGKVENERLDGAWTVRKGRFCRTITAPERLAGTQCQRVRINGDVYTFIRRDGSRISFTAE